MVDVSGFEPISVRLLQAALLARLVRGAVGLRSPPTASGGLAATKAPEELPTVRSQPSFPPSSTAPPDFQ